MRLPDKEELLTLIKKALKRWWGTIIIWPFAFFSIHQVYKALTFNILFAISYSFPFPYNIVNFFLTHFDLIVHEAGHTFFSIFGNRFIQILGGSIYQVLLPAIILFFCWFNRYWIGMQFSLTYWGFSWISVAMYAGDAAERQLPLIGNLGEEAHDWHNILVHLDRLDQYESFAITFAVIGAICYLAAIILPMFRRKYKYIDLKVDL